MKLEDEINTYLAQQELIEVSEMLMRETATDTVRSAFRETVDVIDMSLLNAETNPMAKERLRKLKTKIVNRLRDSQPSEKEGSLFRIDENEGRRFDP